MEPRQAKTGQDKGRQGKRREGKGKEEEGKGLEGKGVEKCGWGLLSRGGGGVHPTLRGRPPQGPGPRVPRQVVATCYDFLAILTLSTFPSLFRCLLGSILAPFSLPTCFQKSTKIHYKSMPRCLPILTSFWDRFLIHVHSRLRPPESSKDICS